MTITSVVADLTGKPPRSISAAGGGFAESQ